MLSFVVGYVFKIFLNLREIINFKHKIQGRKVKIILSYVEVKNDNRVIRTLSTPCVPCFSWSVCECKDVHRAGAITASPDCVTTSLS